jgi:hypothetical protein
VSAIINRIPVGKKVLQKIGDSPHMLFCNQLGSNGMKKASRPVAGRLSMGNAGQVVVVTGVNDIVTFCR